MVPEVLNTINKVLPQSTKSISLMPLSNRFAVLSPLSEDAPVPITSSHLGTDSRDALHTVDRHHLLGDTPSDRATAPASSDPLPVSVDTDLQNHFAKLTIRLDESNKRTVKFQEDTTTPKPVLAPAAAAMWRQSRSSLQTLMKAGVCSELLSNLCKSDIATPWAAGLRPLPPYCREDQVLCKTISFNIRKKAALQIQQCTAAYLKEKDIREKETSRPTTLLIAAEKVSRDNPTALDNAIDITSSMVSPTKAALIRDLRERKSYLSQCQLTEKDRLNIDWIGGSPRSIHLGENENPIDVTPLGPTLESSTTTRKSSAPGPSRYPNTSRTRQETIISPISTKAAPP